jgi:hypothetical protein
MIRTRFVIATLSVAVLGLSACGGGSDSVVDKIDDAAADTTVSGDNSSSDTLVPGVIPGLSADCQKMYQQLIGALGAAGTGSDQDMGAMFDALAESLPDELKDDALVMGEAFGAYTEILQQYENDMAKALADPDAQKALAALNSDEVTQASENITNYFDETCPQS